MRTVILGRRPAELEALIERRRATGADLYDEVWGGEYHMAPEAHFFRGYLDDQLAAVLRPLAQAAGLIGSGPFNLGQPNDFRVPDRGLHRQLVDAAWLSTAAVVVEILSPDDETFEKLPFYAAKGVDEVLIVDREQRRVTCLVRDGDHYEDEGASPLLGVSAAELASRISWPGAAS